MKCYTIYWLAMRLECVTGRRLWKPVRRVVVLARARYSRVDLSLELSVARFQVHDFLLESDYARPLPFQQALILLAHSIVELIFDTSLLLQHLGAGLEICDIQVRDYRFVPRFPLVV